MVHGVVAVYVTFLYQNVVGYCHAVLVALRRHTETFQSQLTGQYVSYLVVTTVVHTTSSVPAFTMLRSPTTGAISCRNLMVKRELFVPAKVDEVGSMRRWQLATGNEGQGFGEGGVLQTTVLGGLS